MLWRRTRYLLGLGFAALLLALVGLAIMLATQQFRSDSRMVARSYDVIGRLEQARATLLAGISAQRSYLLTGDTHYRQEFAMARPAIREELAGMSALMTDPRQITGARQLGILIEQRLDSATEGMRIYEAHGLASAQAYVRSNHGLQQMQQVERLAANINQTERSLLALRTAASDHSARVLLVLGALGIPLSLVILTSIFVLLSREVRERSRAESKAQSLNEELGHSVLELERVSGDLRELSRYASLLQSCRNLPEALDVTRRVLSSLLPECAGTLYLLRASQDHAVAEITWGEHAAPAHPVLTPQECWALRRAQPHCVEDIHTGMVCAHVDPPPPGSAAITACLPLTAQGINLGLLYLSSKGHRSPPRLATATTAAEQLSLALSNLRLQDSLRQQSIRDPLTGLYNRRYLEESLPREIARCERRGLPLAVMMLDLDHFKAFNDSHGHDGGDALLTAFGLLLQSKCREEDIACRYGGEEFTLILPEASAVIAQQRAEEIRTAVELLTVRHLQREIGGVTVSIGLALFPQHGTDAGALLRLADATLYRAKHNGRNRIETYGSGD